MTKIANLDYISSSIVSCLSSIVCRFDSFRDLRRGKNTRYKIGDLVLGGFSLFLLNNSSFLEQQRSLRKGNGSGNYRHLFGLDSIPSDASIRDNLDEIPPSEVLSCYADIYSQMQQQQVFERYKCGGLGFFISFDGTQTIDSEHISCGCCNSRKLKNGKIQYYHSCVQAVLSHPSQAEIIPMEPEFIEYQNDCEKQDCELNASKRWLEKHLDSWKARLGESMTFVGDDLYAHEPFCNLLIEKGQHFIFVCKPDSHKCIYTEVALLEGANMLSQHSLTEKVGKANLRYVYKFANQLPIREATSKKDQPLKVNWLDMTVYDEKNTQVYHNSFMTEFPISVPNVHYIGQGGRNRWKVENQAFWTFDRKKIEKAENLRTFLFMRKKRTSQEFCLALLGLSVCYKKALSNVVMSLASDELASVSVELSLSALCHYQYSSISKSVTNISEDAESYKQVLKEIQELQLLYLRELFNGRLRLITDCTPLLKRHSNCLASRQYVAVANNKILDNKPIDVGYLVSSVQLGFADKWTVPLHQKRVELNENSLDVAVNQIVDILKLSPLIEEELIINTADSAYGTPRFLSPLYDVAALVNIVRLRAGMKLWTQNRQTGTGGANRIYGDCHYLNLETQDKTYKLKGESVVVHQTSLYDLAPNEQHTLQAETTKGRKITIEISRWNNLLRRAKKEHSMKEKPLDIVGIIVKDTEKGTILFQRPLFIAISGSQKSKIESQEAYVDYRHRFDIEHNFRFQKQHLLLQNYQTPDVQTLDNWLLVVQLANTLLFLAADEVKHTCKKWQESNDKPSEENQRLTPCQTKKAAQNLFLTFDPKPFIPLKSKKGKGRIEGTVFTHRTIKKVNKKPKK